LLSLAEHRFVGPASNEPATDLASTKDSDYVVVAVERNAHVDIDIWETSQLLSRFESTSPTNSHKENNGGGFFADLNGDD
jgi:hypothetical protein